MNYSTNISSADSPNLWGNFYATPGIKAGGRVAGTDVRAIVQPGDRLLELVEVSTNSLKHSVKEGSRKSVDRYTVTRRRSRPAGLELAQPSLFHTHTQIESIHLYTQSIE